MDVDLEDWERTRQEAQKKLPEQANIEIAFWEAEKRKIRRLSHQDAVKQLIKALKIDSKIKVIKRAAGI